MKTTDMNLHIKISSVDKARIKERMKAAGTKNMSAYMRKMALNGYIIVLDLSDVHELLRLLSINSNNINQCAKKANTTGLFFKEDIETIKQQQTQILGEMRKIASRLANV